MDSELLALRRACQASPDDKVLHFKYRMACCRAGRFELTGLEPGDTVTVDEQESPWIRGVWEGEVIRVFDAGDKYVRPKVREGQSLRYRVRPSPAYLVKGLYLTREDIANVSIPVFPKDPEQPSTTTTTEV